MARHGGNIVKEPHPGKENRVQGPVMINKIGNYMFTSCNKLENKQVY